jgi:hypothetical protein
MSFTTVTTKIVGYNPETRSVSIAVKTNLCQRAIEDYDPVNIDLAQASIPYDINAAVKDAIAGSYHAILLRHLKESKSPEFFQELEQTVQAVMDTDPVRTFVVGKDIPAPAETELADESSIQTTLDTTLRVI